MRRNKLITSVILSAALATQFALVQSHTANAAGSRQSEAKRVSKGLIKEIRHELVTLPYYGLFDWLEGEVRPDGTLILRGEVVRPSTKKDAESRVKDIEGVENVVNEIEVLPLSPSDDRIRAASYRALFNANSPLFRYATRAVPPIHIIVKRGRVALKGVVATRQESQIAFIKARSVSGVFEVKNELRVESEDSH